MSRLYFTIDKLGGRNFYAPMIQTALPDGWVMPLREGAESSEYRVEGLKVPVHIAVRPAPSQIKWHGARFDAEQVPGEVLMKQFNSYWLTHVPGLTPTAGIQWMRAGSSRRYACLPKSGLPKNWSGEKIVKSRSTLVCSSSARWKLAVVFREVQRRHHDVIIGHSLGGQAGRQEVQIAIDPSATTSHFRRPTRTR